MVMKEMQTLPSLALGKIIMYTVCSQHPLFLFLAYLQRRLTNSVCLPFVSTCASSLGYKQSAHDVAGKGDI